MGYHEHSITFVDTANNKTFNTYTTWNLVSDGRPDVASPELKDNYVDIPGTNGSLDFSEALNGRTYKDRTGSWSFYVENSYGRLSNEWSSRWRDIMKSLHGRYFDKIWLDDEGYIDPITGLATMNWYYTGRIFIKEWKSEPQFSKVTIDYILQPYKHRDPTSHAITDWLWDSLFFGEEVNPIMYGSFNVAGSKQRTLVNDTGDELDVIAIPTTQMSVVVNNGEPVTLPASEETIFKIPNGNSLAIFTGTGNVSLSYDGSTQAL